MNKFYISTGLYSQRAFDVLNSICESYELVFLSSQRNVIKQNFPRTDNTILMKLEDIKTELSPIITKVNVAIDYLTHEVILVPYDIEYTDDIEDDLGLSRNEIRKTFAKAIEFFAENMTCDVAEFPNFRYPESKFHKFVVRDAKIVADVMLGKNIKEKYAKKDINAIVGLENDVVKQEMIKTLEEEIDKLLQKIADIDDMFNQSMVKIDQEAKANVANLVLEKDMKAKFIMKEVEKHIADYKRRMLELAGMNSKNKRNFFDLKSFKWVHFKDNMIDTEELAWKIKSE